MKKYKILFVCLGNICRSPTADGIMRKLVKDAGLEHLIEIDSAGTGGWHIGSLPDPRSMQHAAKRGYDLSSLRARKVHFNDFSEYDLILAMDNSNYSDLFELCEHQHRNKVKLFLEHFGDEKGRETRQVPDPYYKGAEGFEEVLDLVEAACANLLEYVKQEIKP
jgi:protein-tyrosine phosphatase